MLKKILFIFLSLFLIFITSTLYFIDKRYFLCPIEYRMDIMIRSDEVGLGDFGTQRAGDRKHAGVDLYAPIGTRVRSVRFGRVIEVGFHKTLGNYVELRHSGNLVTIYGHLQRILVKSGQWVNQGKIIGYVGKTGNANHPKILPHLHFEIRQNNTPFNPMVWLEPK